MQKGYKMQEIIQAEQDIAINISEELKYGD